MDHEAEVIKTQMEETRSSLAEKLETLEQQVVGTVQQATAAVATTVETVKDTVETVKGAVEDTVEMARGSVQDTVGAIQETLNLSHQVRRHPWGVFGGSVALGLLGGYLLPSSPRPRGYGRRETGYARERSSLTRASAPPVQEATSGYAPGVHESAGVAPPSRPSSVSKLGDLLGSELAKLKGLAIGTALGLVRDGLMDHLPEPMRPDVTNVLNDLTEKLGGKVLPSPVLGQFQRNEASAARGNGSLGGASHLPS
jgi:ElaB/YqjD/DUF883 family membrane-anchored ribosome-binding protein